MIAGPNLTMHVLVTEEGSTHQFNTSGHIHSWYSSDPLYHFLSDMQHLWAISVLFEGGLLSCHCSKMDAGSGACDLMVRELDDMNNKSGFPMDLAYVHKDGTPKPTDLHLMQYFYSIFSAFFCAGYLFNAIMLYSY